MAGIRIDIPFADECLSRPTLVRRVLIPTIVGFTTLCLLRFALSWAAADRYSEPTVTKYLIVAGLILVCARAISRAIYAMRVAMREHFLATYIRPDSQVYRILSGQWWNVIVASVSSVVFASLAYSVVQTYSLVDIVCLSLAMAVGLLVSQVLGFILTESLKAHVSHLFLSRARRGITLCSVIVVAVLLALVHDTFSPLRHCDESEVIPRLKESVRHPVLAVQRVNRAMGYFNAQLIRARENVSFPFGWIVYLFLLVPNSISLYALVCIFLGADVAGVPSSRGSPHAKQRLRTGGVGGGASTAILLAVGCAVASTGCGISSQVEEARKRAGKVEKQIRESYDAATAEAERKLRDAEERLRQVEEKLRLAEARARDVGRDINDLMQDDRPQAPTP